MPADRKYRVYFGKPLIGFQEREAVMEVLQQRTLTNGGIVRAFEEKFQEYTGGMAVALSSCTAALHLASMMFFKPGDEVILPANAHLSAANAVELVGATAVFCDVHRSTGNIDPKSVLSVISDRTKGIICVHYLGIPCDMGALRHICRERELYLIEDCALALGTHYDGRHVGLWGDVGTFSFYPTKHITTGEGGMLISNKESVIEKARSLRRFGQTERYGDISSPGLNYRMTEMQAAIGIEQMDRLPVFMSQRLLNLDTISRGLADFERVGGSYGVTIFPKVDRDEMKRLLLNEMVETSVYYPKPLPKLDYYKRKARQYLPAYPNAESFCDDSLCLPIGPHLSKNHVRHIIESFRKCASHLSVARAS